MKLVLDRQFAWTVLHEAGRPHHGGMPHAARVRLDPTHPALPWWVLLQVFPHHLAALLLPAMTLLRALARRIAPWGSAASPSISPASIRMLDRQDYEPGAPAAELAQRLHVPLPTSHQPASGLTTPPV